MSNLQPIETVVYDAIKEMNDQLPADRQIKLDHSSSLFDGRTGLDSISLVSSLEDFDSTANSRIDARTSCPILGLNSKAQTFTITIK